MELVSSVHSGAVHQGFEADSILDPQNRNPSRNPLSPLINLIPSPQSLFERSSRRELWFRDANDENFGQIMFNFSGSAFSRISIEVRGFETRGFLFCFCTWEQLNYNMQAQLIVSHPWKSMSLFPEEQMSNASVFPTRLWRLTRD